jgi:hypothetical protein
MIAEIARKRNERRISHRISEPQGGKARSFALRACFVVHDILDSYVVVCWKIEEED